MGKKLFVVILLLSLVHEAFCGRYFASDLAKKNPQFDLTDIFVFKSRTPQKTVFIMAFNPESKKNVLSNYSSQGIYRFCIGADATFKSGVSPTFTFKDNRVQFYLNPQPEPKINETGDLMGEGPVNKDLVFSNGVRIWTGTVLDLFQGNAVGIAAFKQRAAEGQVDLSTFGPGKNVHGVRNLSSTVIVLEVPNQMLPSTLHYYAATSMEVEPNHWRRVDRIAHVLFPYLYLSDQFNIRKYIASGHQMDAQVKAAISGNALHYVTAAGFQHNPKAYTASLLKKIYPDVLTYQVGTDAAYSIDTINGRPLQADAMDVALAMLLGSKNPIDDHLVSISPRQYQNQFPYVMPVDDAYIGSKDKSLRVQATKHLAYPDNGESIQSSKEHITVLIIMAAMIIFLVASSLVKRKTAQP